MTIISTDRTTAFVFDHANQMLIVKAGVVLAVEFDYAVVDGPFGSDGYANCIVANYGAIYSNYTGVVMTGDDATVINYASGSIVGVQGVYLGGYDGHLDNQGYVYGTDTGVELQATSTSIANSGLIASDGIGIKVSTNGTATIENRGTIQAELAVYVTSNAPHVYMTNTGLVVGEVYLGSTTGGDVRNSGVIEGQLEFGDGDDRYDGRGGEVGRLLGGSGVDTLIGSAGDETMAGGYGADRLKGGAGGDVFAYYDLAESQGKFIDVIRGWDGADAIDLSFIDTNANKAGTQPFTFGGQIGATDPVGEDMVQYFRKGGDTYVVADVNGDGKADFAVRLLGSYILDAGDFVL
jgi:hemolysin type calcium-binding protein